jgi:hypothetical protein
MGIDENAIITRVAASRVTKTIERRRAIRVASRELIAILGEPGRVGWFQA